MVNDRELKKAFHAVKQDMESMKDEVAFLAKRIAQLESNLIKRAVSGSTIKSKTKKKK